MTTLQFLVLIALGVLILHCQEGWSVCVGTSPSTCLVKMDEAETNETLKYILEKYEEVDMKIASEPFGVYGKRITTGDTEEVHIVFKYSDKTPADVIQNCGFVVTSRPGECQLIRTFCNAFVANTPRPLLRPKALVVCGDGGGGEADNTQVRVIEEDDDDEEEVDDAGASVDPDVEILKETTTEMSLAKE